MRFRPMWSLLLALSLAVGFSLGDLHCAWMAVSSHGPGVAAAVAAPAPGHACCKSGAATTPAAPADDDAPCCGCKTVPAWTLPSVASPAIVAPAASAVVVLAPTAFSTPLPRATWTLPVPDTGSPPRLVALRAHGLRAPPTTV